MTARKTVTKKTKKQAPAYVWSWRTDLGTFDLHPRGHKYDPVLRLRSYTHDYVDGKEQIRYELIRVDPWKDESWYMFSFVAKSAAQAKRRAVRYFIDRLVDCANSARAEAVKFDVLAARLKVSFKASEGTQARATDGVRGRAKGARGRMKGNAG